MQAEIVEVKEPAEPRPEPAGEVGGWLTVCERMVERGITAETLEKILAVKIKTEDRAAEQAFNAAMVRCQQRIAKLPPLVKNKPGYQFKYTPYEDIQTAIEPIYLEEGFAPSWTTKDSPLAEHMRIVMVLMHSQGHSREYSIDIPIDGKEGSKGGKSSMNDLQAHGSTFSYGMRYLLKGAFNVKLVGEDNDGARFAVLIGEEQQAALGRLLEEAAADLPKFFEFCSAKAKRPITALAEIPSAIFDEVARKLREKIAVAQGQKGGGK